MLVIPLAQIPDFELFQARRVPVPDERFDFLVDYFKPDRSVNHRFLLASSFFYLGSKIFL